MTTQLNTTSSPPIALDICQILSQHGIASLDDKALLEFARKILAYLPKSFLSSIFRLIREFEASLQAQNTTISVSHTHESIFVADDINLIRKHGNGTIKSVQTQKLSSPNNITKALSHKTGLNDAVSQENSSVFDIQSNTSAASAHMTKPLEPRANRPGSALDLQDIASKQTLIQTTTPVKMKTPHNCLPYQNSNSNFISHIQNTVLLKVSDSPNKRCSSKNFFYCDRFV